jgi:hypothetical protein
MHGLPAPQAGTPSLEARRTRFTARPLACASPMCVPRAPVSQRSLAGTLAGRRSKKLEIPAGKNRHHFTHFKEGPTRGAQEGQGRPGTALLGY